MRMQNRKIRITAALLGFALACTACGKQAEKVTNYGAQDTAAEKEAGSTQATGTEADSGTTVSTSAPEPGNGHQLSDWLGGKELVWKDSFTIGSTPANADLTFRIFDTKEESDAAALQGYFGIPSYNTEELPAYRANSITKEDVHEAETVKKLLGDDVTEVRGQVSKANGDAENVVDMIVDCYYRYHEDEADDTPHYGEERDAVLYPAWEDGDGYFWHTWEGKYQGIDYQLVIGYLGEMHEKVLSFFPKNPGLLVGDPDLKAVIPVAEGILVHTIMVSEEPEDWDRVTAEEIGLTENRVTENSETLAKEAEQFAKDVLFFNPFAGEIGLDAGTGLVFSKGDETLKDLEGAVLNGYCSVWNWEFGGQSVHIGDDEPANYGEIWLTDKGVVGMRAYVAYDFAERLSDQVAILPFEKVKTAIAEELAQNLDLSKATSSTINLNGITFEYYPIPSPDKPQEYTFVPVWVVELMSGPAYYMGLAVFNAADGSLIRIEYYE